MSKFIELVLIGGDFFVADQAFFAGFLVAVELELRVADLG